jgi:glycerol-3-phosphate dehydrogenase
MNRETADVAIIGGGITGAGLARDCAMRGLRTILLEKSQPGRQTTASSSRLIHGGLRYLLYDRQTTLETSWDAGYILQIAAPLLTRLPILWPVYRGHAHGLAAVDALLQSYDGFQRLKGGKPHLRLTAEETLRLLPTLKKEGLRGALTFDEWQVDPVRLVESNLSSAERHGAAIRRDCPVESIEKAPGGGILLKGPNMEVAASLAVNAGGPWAGEIARLAGARVPLILRRGTHLVYERRLVPFGLILEAEDRRRYIFILPGPNYTLVGPTDVEHSAGPGSCAPSQEEVAYLLATARRYFKDFPERFDRVVCGLRPIVGESGGKEQFLSRGFKLYGEAEQGGPGEFLTLAGGKMSDYRLMAETAADAVTKKLGPRGPCRTALETLEGKEISASSRSALLPKPSSLLRAHPRLRYAHSLAFLAACLMRRTAAAATRRLKHSKAEEFLDAYEMPASFFSTQLTAFSIVPPPKTKSPS